MFRRPNGQVHAAGYRGESERADHASTPRSCPEAVGTFTNTATLTGGGDLSLPRAASDTFTVNDQRQPNLIVAKTHTPVISLPVRQRHLQHRRHESGSGADIRHRHGRRHDPGRPHADVCVRVRLDLQHPGPARRLHAPGCVGVRNELQPITIVASVALDAQSGANIATVAGGGDTHNGSSPPDNYVVVGTPRLAIAKSHEGDFFVGQQGATYTVLVSNVGTAPTSGEVIVNDPVPLGMTPVSASGPGWTCAIEAQTVECRRSDALAPQQAYPALTITVNVGLVALTTTNIATAQRRRRHAAEPLGPGPDDDRGPASAHDHQVASRPGHPGRARSAVHPACLEQRHRTDRRARSP